jgi:hypothetical protein
MSKYYIMWAINQKREKIAFKISEWEKIFASYTSDKELITRI